jgi:hypothetical protein
LSTRIDTSQVQNLQQIEAVIAGPDGADRLYTVAGQLVDLWLQADSLANPDDQRTQKFTVLLGPVLTRHQFVRAIATASVVSTTVTLTSPPPSEFGWGLSLVDADWDDESGRVELRIEVKVHVTGQNNSAAVVALGFQVTILASHPA